jgi:hypothetical protein
MRYYLHGDEKENEPGIYYCRACDYFEPKKHFYEECTEKNHFERFQRTLKIWKQIKKSGTQYTRPTNANNIFE